MVETSDPNATQILLPVATPTVQALPARYVGTLPPWRFQQAWAPAWLYSALNWLSKPYYDASNAPQRFGSFLVGSDVDPYSLLGATRLFMIFHVENMFRLTLATDANSTAPMSGGTSYPNTDDGIQQLYLALSASPIFASVKDRYVPGQTSTDLTPNPHVASIGSGYDPATGLRSIVFGSAVSQIVPLGDFTQTHNEQIYDDDPVIVPIMTALVYDVTQNNTLGGTTFILPIYYTRDQISAGNYSVSKFDTATTMAGQTVHHGQTVVFPGGPGYNDADATALKLGITTVVSAQGRTFTTYSFGTATVTTISTLAPKVEAGIMSLTYTAASPASVFANQQIIGFYRDATWTTCLCLDIGDRSHFANGGGAIVLDLEFSRRAQEARDSLPLKVTGLELDAVKRRIGSLTSLRSVPTAA